VRAAAVVLIGLGASLPWLWPRWGGAEREAGAGQGEMQEYTTARGMRLRLRLSDGTHVVLGVASRLRLPRSFGRAGARDLYLDGEAYFDVRYDAARPFRVHTATAVTQDLGTKFSLEGRDADTTARVVVAEGSVELRAQRLPPDRRGALLTAGQLGVLAPSGDALVRSDVDVRRELAWTEGKLVFDDVPLRDALPRLSRWYDLDFTLADSALGARVLTAEFGGEALAETLRLLAATLGVGYERQGRNVILSKRRER
jgi:ferric-dicitrate binding protein FerR (iron transport regulator)